MNTTARKAEILNAIPSFSQERYSKADMLSEAFKLQSEMVNLTFSDGHAENAKLKIWHVHNHLSKLNESCEHVADKELERFSNGCREMSNYISGEISGNKGEECAAWSLRAVNVYRKILRNIELSDEGHRTELDFIVLTKKAVFVVEVKNTKQNILIDEKGNYHCLKGDRVYCDKNIGEKMNDKVILLRNVLETAGVKNPNIVSLLVFTENSANVVNNYPYIKHCFKSDLPHIINSYDGRDIYSVADIYSMVDGINAAKDNGVHTPDFDVKLVKQAFADTMVALENYRENKQNDEREPEEATVKSCVRFKHRNMLGDVVLAAVPISGVLAVTAIGLAKVLRK